MHTNNGLNVEKLIADNCWQIQVTLVVTIIWKYVNKNNQSLRGDMAFKLDKSTDSCAGTVGS